MAATAEDKSEPTRPLALALPSPSVHPAAGSRDGAEEEEAATGGRSVRYLRTRRRRVLCCCGCCVTAAVVVGVVVLALALTVFRVKDPRITMNGVALTAVTAGPGSGVATSPVAANATLTADVSIKNPNVASMRFSRSETVVTLRETTVSVAYAPAGRVGADRTVRMNLTVDLLGDRLAGAMNATGLLLGQELDLATYTELNGTVKVLGIYKKDLEMRMNCSIVIQVGGVAGALVPGAASGLQSRGLSCVARVK